jgi:hypothetical protein
MPVDDDQVARDQLTNHLMVALYEAMKVGDQTATQAVYIELGLLPDSITSGEFALAGGSLGMIMGAMVDNGASLADVELAIFGNRAPIDRLPLTPRRRDQLYTHMEFARLQVSAICHPTTSRAVMAAMFAVFSRTMVAAGLARKESPA